MYFDGNMCGVDNIDASLFTNIIREKGEASTVQSLRVTLES